MALTTIDTQASVKTAKVDYLKLVGGRDYVYSFEEVDKKLYDVECKKRQADGVAYIIQKRVDKEKGVKVDKYFKRTLERVDTYKQDLDNIEALVNLVNSKVDNYELKVEELGKAQEVCNDKAQQLINLAIQKAKQLIVEDTGALLNTHDVKRIAVEVLARSTQRVSYTDYVNAINSFQFYVGNDLLKHAKPRTQKQKVHVDISKFSIVW